VNTPARKKLAMPTGESVAPERPVGAQRMRLRYGFNEIDGWWYFSQGEQSERIRRRLRLMGTQIIRIFVFDKPVPDPVLQWPLFAGYVQGVLDTGAVPMITFAKYRPPYDSERNIRTFVARCTDIVWGCTEQWGAEVVKDWYWCIWNEPNNPLVGGNLTFEQYKRVYVEIAAAILPLLEPHLSGKKARIGGPAIDGTQRSYWMDWIARLISEVDDRMVGFVSWHRYADWRPAAPAATLGLDLLGTAETPNGAAFEAMLMAQTPDYEARARGVARLLYGRDILNFCGELNTIAHHEDRYTLGLNQNVFGAAYYASALIHLLRGGAELEMRWTATSMRWTADGEDDSYGLMNIDGDPTPACLAKQLFAQHVRYGDWVRFPLYRPENPDVDAVVAWGDNGRRSGVFVHITGGPRVVTVADWDDELLECGTVLRIDGRTGGRVVRELFDGTIRFDGYGVAVVSNAAGDTVLD